MSARRLGIDVRAALRGPCGIARVAVELSLALARAAPEVELLLYGASRHGRAWAAPLPAELLAQRNVRLFAPRLPAKALHLAARVPGFRTEWLTGPLDAFVHTDLVFVDGLRCPQLVWVHDLAFEVSREFHDAGFHEPVEQRLRAALARAAAIVTPSEATRADLVARWAVDPVRVAVVPLGADHVLREPAAARRDPRPDPARPYLLHAGTLEPRKNVPRLVRAYRRARARGLAHDLVLVGPWGWRRGELQLELARADPDAPVFVRGEVDAGELVAWLRGADALCYPSLWEGFGLPIVEAFALGVPVVTSARSATREVAGDAALQVDPESEEELAAALLRIGGDAELRRDLAARGRARAAAFTWDAAARRLLALLPARGS